MPASPADSAIYRDLFSDQDTARLFTDSAQIRAMLLVEGALARVQGRLGVIPETAAAYIERAAREIQIDPAELAAETARNGVPVPGLIAAFRKAMQAKGTKPALRESITAGEKDYSGLVSKLKSAGVEVVAYGGYHTEVALILRQAQQAGLKLTVMGGDTMTNTELVTAAGAAADNVLFTFSPDPRKNAAAADVVKKFRDAKVEPEGYVMYAYAAMQLFAQAAEQGKSVKYADLEKAMRTGTFDTVLGKLNFDAKGDNKLPGFMVYQWKGGQYDYVK